MVAIYSTLREDLYVVYAGVNQGSDVPTIHVFLNRGAESDAAKNAAKK